jgi:hypothetical protein
MMDTVRKDPYLEALMTAAYTDIDSSAMTVTHVYEAYNRFAVKAALAELQADNDCSTMAACTCVRMLLSEVVGTCLKSEPGGHMYW